MGRGQPPPSLMTTNAIYFFFFRSCDAKRGFENRITRSEAISDLAQGGKPAADRVITSAAQEYIAMDTRAEAITIRKVA